MREDIEFISASATRCLPTARWLGVLPPCMSQTFCPRSGLRKHGSPRRLWARHFACTCPCSGHVVLLHGFLTSVRLVFVTISVCYHAATTASQAWTAGERRATMSRATAVGGHPATLSLSTELPSRYSASARNVAGFSLT